MESFLDALKRRHQAAAMDIYPSSERICQFFNDLMHALFPELKGNRIHPDAIERHLKQSEQTLQSLISGMDGLLPQSPVEITADFMEQLPTIYDALNKDAEAILTGDPAATCLYEVIRAYPGFYAISAYRVAHALYTLGVPLIPRVITEFAHTRTGIDIHPGAVIGPYCCIDHGTGIVIGETTVIGSYVKIYQGVTLGALSIDKSMAQHKRHPTIEDHVIIYAGATILGGDTVIGHHAIIGGNVWLIKSVEPHARIYYHADGRIKMNEQLK